MKIFESVPGTNIRFRQSFASPQPETRPSVPQALESPTSEMRALGRQESPSTNHARTRQTFHSKDHSRTGEVVVQQGGAVVSPQGTPLAGGPEPGQGKSSVVRGARPNAKPLPLPFPEVEISEVGKEAMVGASAGIAVLPARLVTEPGFRVLSILVGEEERLLEAYRQEGVPSEQFGEDVSPEEMGKVFDLKACPGKARVSIKAKRLGNVSRFKATLFATPCEEPVTAPPVEAGEPPKADETPVTPPSFNPFA